MRLSKSLRRSNGGVLAVLVVLVVLLPLLVSSAFVQHGHQEASEDRALEYQAEQQAANVADYFARSRSLTQILATNPSFAAFYESPGRRLDKIRGNSADVRQANEALAYLETLFPGSIGEACFIDAGGAENARAVKGKVAPLADLSLDETGAEFFPATFDLRPGQVYQSRPYVSPDTHEWVIANSAPVALAGRPTPAIVHFEVTLESLRLAAAALSEKHDIQIIDRRTGNVLIDTRWAFTGESQPAGLRTVRPLPPDALTGRTGVLTSGGYRLAYHHLDRVGENANDWIIVARSQSPSAGWLGSVGLWQAVVFLALALLIPICFFAWRRSQTDLSRAAHTDGLTGLANRRSLATRLEEATLSATPERPLLLAMYDLDGFKHYNDTFGHPAGDALLARLAQRLDAALVGVAEPFRMGGDEFCVIAELKAVEESLDVAALAAEALRERGEGFSVSASYGAVLLPVETTDPAEALRLADQRMYAQKSSSRLSAPRQTTDALLQIILEHNPELCDHASEVAELAEAVAASIGLSSEQTIEVKRAASLHDIGKLAIPESILGKRGPLTAHEWEFIRQHTIIGERILAAAPSLSRCGKFVRASHEAWDGTGYPDRLAGETIPIEARVIAVCDAYHAMTTPRPYASSRTRAEALAELKRCSGTQFDPAVVRALAAELTADSSKSAPAVSS
jgi:diguanylate cyclase (GGDEF)-like protein/putative nucleotidyltransferase with HDIG domain